MPSITDIYLRIFDGIKNAFRVRIVDDTNIIAYNNKSTDKSIIYVGEALIGSSTSQAVWRIQEINTKDGRIKWAGGGEFNQIYDNRETLIYS